MATAPLDHYGLTGLPFQITPDSRAFFASTEHQRAISHLVYGLEQHEGFIVVTGEIGAGKTTLVDLLTDRLGETDYQFARVQMTHLSADDLLRIVAAEFGVIDAPDKATLFRRSEERLRALRAAGRRPLLIVDEAQGLTVASLEALRMISNLSMGGRSLLQIVLLGQPEFRDTLASPELNQLRQRILAFCHLGPLAAGELRGYVEHRLTMVGWTGNPQWEDAALARIYHHTGGIPRRINRLCARVILQGALREEPVILADLIDAIAGELDAELGTVTVLPVRAPSSAVAAQAGKAGPNLARLFELLALGRPLRG